MEIPNMMICIKIAELYPLKTSIIAIEDEATKKYNSALLHVENGIFNTDVFNRGEYPVIYSEYKYKWNTKEEAIERMIFMIDTILNIVTTMSN